MGYRRKGQGAKALHKRQILEAIPRAKREVERVPVAATETAEGRTRKSARPRKPKGREGGKEGTRTLHRRPGRRIPEPEEDS